MSDEKADRPTREAVERALKLLDGSVLAAEVRALRAEANCGEGHDPERICCAHAADVKRLRDGLNVETRRADEWQPAALAARTPQPAEQLRPDTLQIVRNGPGSGCPRVEGRCPACRARSLFLGAGARITCASLSCTDPCAVDAYLDPAPLPAVPDGEDAAVDEMEGHFIDANERMGEALVAIGMALGLPRPCVGATWGAPEILARIAQWNGSLGSCYDHSILGHDDARVAAPVVGCSDCLDALTTPLPAGEDVPARLDAAAEVFNALGAEWGTVADYLSMTADELRDNCTPDVRAAVAAALARPTEPGHG